MKSPFVNALLFIAYSIGVGAPALAQVVAEPADPIASAVFAADSIEKSEPLDRRRVGFAIRGLNDYGFVYNKKISTNRLVWVDVIYGADRYLFVEPYDPSAQVADVDIHMTQHLQTEIGVEQVFHLTQNKYWGITLGAGIGLNRDTYRSKYYRQLCTSYCGFDPRAPIQKNETDKFASMSGRLGIVFLETQVWGLKGDYKIAAVPTLVRTGRFAFIGPDGREFKTLSSSNFSLEALVSF